MFIVKKFVSEQMNKRVKDPENKMSPLQFIKVISGILGVSDFINKWETGEVLTNGRQSLSYILNGC